MKKLLLCVFVPTGSFLFCSAQGTVNNQSSLVSSDTLKLKKISAVTSYQPSGQTNPIISDPLVVENNVQYLEYNAEEGNNLVTSANQVDNSPVIFPIQAEGYTDPNYELNKQKSLEVTQQWQAQDVPEKSNEELILDLQNKIKLIKDGTVVDSIAIQKLPYYEQELQLLLNKK